MNADKFKTRMDRINRIYKIRTSERFGYCFVVIL